MSKQETAKFTHN